MEKWDIGRNQIGAQAHQPDGVPPSTLLKSGVSADLGNGAIARAADTPAPEARRAVIESRLPSHTWPTRDLRITAVDTSTGELVVFDRKSGADLVDAVAASCAVPGIWPAV